MSKPPDHTRPHKGRAQKRGLWAERLAALALLFTGHRVLARNYKTKVGEVDLIAKRGNVVSFVEVKARAGHAAAAEAVGPRQRQRIQRAAEQFLMHQPPLQVCDIRFDVCLVTRPWRLSFLRDAWRP